jgi:hypothetical protein
MQIKVRTLTGRVLSLDFEPNAQVRPAHTPACAPRAVVVRARRADRAAPLSPPRRPPRSLPS